MGLRSLKTTVAAILSLVLFIALAMAGPQRALTYDTASGDNSFGTKGLRYTDSNHTTTIGDYAGSGSIAQFAVDADLLTISFADTNLTGRLKVGAGGSTASISKTLSATTTWDPASLVNGASEVKGSVTLTGAAVGDVVTAALTTATSSSWTFQACVTGANTVDVKLTNNTGGTVDLASGTLRVNCIKF